MSRRQIMYKLQYKKDFIVNGKTEKC